MDPSPVTGNGKGHMCFHVLLCSGEYGTVVRVGPRAGVLYVEAAGHKDAPWSGAIHIFASARGRADQ